MAIGKSWMMGMKASSKEYSYKIINNISILTKKHYFCTLLMKAP